MAKFIIKQSLIFLLAFFLFAILANGVSFLLIDTLFAFFDYPNFPATLTNPLYVLFPAVFAYFSVPSLTLISLQHQFSLKKRFALMLESHGFFFFWQVLFWAFFCCCTLYFAEIILQAILGYTKQIDASLTSIYMPLVLTKLMPLFAILFLWISLRTTLYLIKDEEQKSGMDARAEYTFSFTAKEIERAFTLVDIGNTGLLICVLIIFLPLDFGGYEPKLCSQPLIFLVCYLHYYLVHLYRTEKRKCLLLLGMGLQIALFGVALYLEDTLYQIVFAGYFISQAYAYFLFLRHGKDFFTRP